MQVLDGDSLFARAAARGEPVEHLYKAVAHDLDVLQQLAVTETTLAGWVKDNVNGLSDAWLDAACGLKAAPPPPGEDTRSDTGRTSSESGSSGAGWALCSPAPPRILAPPTDEQRAALRADIAGRCAWSCEGGCWVREACLWPVSMSPLQ
jgi:hypothetical protein